MCNISISFRQKQLIAGGFLLLSCISVQASAQEISYPFEVPDEVRAKLDIDTSRSTPVNHMLLGLNCKWPENLYGKVGYNHPDAQKLIGELKPSSLRFPHGVWANFYDWESDGRRITVTKHLTIHRFKIIRT